MWLSHREENVFDSRIYTQSEQSNSRLDIPKLLGLQPMEAFPSWFETNLQSFRETIIGPVCFQTLPPTAVIHNLATRLSKCSKRCISAGLEIPISVCFPTILTDRKGIELKTTRPTWSLLHPPGRASYGIQFCWKWLSKIQFFYENSSSNSKRVTETGGMASIRLSLSSRGISGNAIDLKYLS